MTWKRRPNDAAQSRSIRGCDLPATAMLLGDGPPVRDTGSVPSGDRHGEIRRGRRLWRCSPRKPPHMQDLARADGIAVARAGGGVPGASERGAEGYLVDALPGLPLRLLACLATPQP